MNHARSEVHHFSGRYHSEDISAHVDLARRSKIDDLRWCMVDEIPDEIRRVDRELAEELADEMQRVGQGK